MRPDEFADLVIGVVKNALGPVLERMAAVETRISVLGDVRDRVVGLEVKSAIPPVVPVLPEPEQVDLTPILERLASAEAQLAALGDVRDRVVGLEVKVAIPPAPLPEIPEPFDVTPIVARIVALEAQLPALDVRERVIGLEVKSAIPVVVPAPPPVDLEPVLARLNELEQIETHAVLLRDRVEALEKKTAKEFESIREDVAAVETKAAVPGPMGPAGKDGLDGKNGLDGKDGKDGLDGVNGADGQRGLDGKDGASGSISVENLKMVRRNERLLELCTKDGTPIDGGTIRLSHPFYKGIYGQVPEIERDDLVQWDGAIWIAIKDSPTMRPGSGSPGVTGWRMFTKSGRDGRDAMPVVKAK